MRSTLALFVNVLPFKGNSVFFLLVELKSQTLPYAHFGATRKQTINTPLSFFQFASSAACEQNKLKNWELRTENKLNQIYLEISRKLEIRREQQVWVGIQKKKREFECPPKHKTQRKTLISWGWSKEPTRGETGKFTEVNLTYTS